MGSSGERRSRDDETNEDDVGCYERSRVPCGCAACSPRPSARALSACASACLTLSLSRSRALSLRTRLNLPLPCPDASLPSPHLLPRSHSVPQCALDRDHMLARRAAREWRVRAASGARAHHPEQREGDVVRPEPPAHGD
eukprot:6189125-Pleurochrysis_carterae.AAC.2